jgi:NAD(P)-dependent dehydrogenase (short-subunit alcohol dehydrogenase family)
MRFEDKHVLITGGGSGIGAALTKAFLEEGARVTVWDVIYPSGLQGNDRLVLEVVDVSNEEAVCNAAHSLEERCSGVDVLVNNAGIEWVATLEDTLISDWERVFSVNVKGVYIVTRAVLPLLRIRTGCVINTASQLALVGSSHFTAYTASKAAVLNLTKSLALELAEVGIRVNAVCPGAVDTPLLQRQFQDGKRGPQGTIEDLISMHPLGRLGKPEEIAGPILFLAGREASFITGSALVVDGGYTAR